MAVPILTYGSEIWVVKNREQNIKTVEMEFLRSVARYTRRDQVRNTRIREKLNIFNVTNKILKLRL
jgi:hypothetical protein